MQARGSLKVGKDVGRCWSHPEIEPDALASVSLLILLPPPVLLAKPALVSLFGNGNDGDDGRSPGSSVGEFECIIPPRKNVGPNAWLESLLLFIVDDANAEASVGIDRCSFSDLHLIPLGMSKSADILESI